MFNFTPHLKITYSQLLLYGIHVGHSFSNSILFSAWLVYSYTQNLLIINLYKTLLMWKQGFRSLAFASWSRSPIWFVNLDSSFAGVISHASNSCGELSWTDNWIHGLLSNYKKLIAVFNRLRRYSSNAYKKRQQWVELKNYELLLSRDTWPRAIFVSSVFNSYWPVREALSFGIPCFGVVDTNTLCNFITLPLPGNDESMDCLIFYNDSVSNFILIKKFTLVTNWFYSLRSYKRLITFKNWLLNKWIRAKSVIKPKSKQIVSNNNYFFSLLKYIQFGTNFFLSKNIGLNDQSGYLSIFYPNTIPFFSNDLYLILSKRIKLLYKLLTIRAVKRYWQRKPTRAIELRKRVLLTQLKPFVSKRFLTARFYKNRFFYVLWRNKFSRRRRFWRARIKRSFRTSFFARRFIKYLFYYRYMKYIIPNFLKNYLIGSIETFSNLYIKTIASQFASKIISQPNYLFSIPRKNTIFFRNTRNRWYYYNIKWVKRRFKSFLKSRYAVAISKRGRKKAKKYKVRINKLFSRSSRFLLYKFLLYNNFVKHFSKHISAFKKNKYFKKQFKKWKLFLKYINILFKKSVRKKIYKSKSLKALKMSQMYKSTPLTYYYFGLRRKIKILRRILFKYNKRKCKKRNYKLFIKYLIKSVKLKYCLSKRLKLKLKRYYFRFITVRKKRFKIRYFKKISKLLLKINPILLKSRHFTKFVRKQRFFFRNRFIYFFKYFNNFLLTKLKVYISRRKFNRNFINKNYKHLAATNFSIFLYSNRTYSNILYNLKSIQFFWSYKQELLFCLLDFNHLWITMKIISSFRKRSTQFKTVRARLVRNKSKKTKIVWRI